MLQDSETCLVKKENEVALQQADMRVIRWMCDVQVTDRITCNELTERLEVDDNNYSVTAK